MEFRLHPAGRPAVTRLLGAGIVLLTVPGLFHTAEWLRPVGALLVAAGAFLAWFYRDPGRSSGAGPEAVLSAADGKVIQIQQLEHCPELDGPATRVSVFMSPLNVHVNRAAVAGTVVRVEYRPGNYLMAFHEKSSDLNEANLLVLEDDQGRRVAHRQIAGFLARRVVCLVREGQRLERGQRYGIIKLGSRMDHFLPTGVVVRVELGDKVVAGESILGEWT
jgi:phosphatidylserine decarboxylase